MAHEAKKDILERIVELVRDDPELKKAIINTLEAKALADYELAMWRRRRNV